MYNLVSAVRFEGSGFPCTKQHLDNQKWAQDSWALLGLKWTSLARVGHVYCHELVEELIKHDVGAHMDSDIILTEPILKVFEFIKSKKEPAWATSHRYCFDELNYPNFIENSEITSPYGVSIFIGNKLFWEEWLEKMPKNLSRFGVTDDQGLLSFGNSYHSENSWNFTNLKCVFHPNHEGRAEHRGSFNKDVEMDITRAGLPTKKLEL